MSSPNGRRPSLSLLMGLDGFESEALYILDCISFGLASPSSSIGYSFIMW